MPYVRLEDLAEGGFVNDRRGKATRRMRRSMKGQRIPNPPSEYEKSHRRMNKMMERFK